MNQKNTENKSATVSNRLESAADQCAQGLLDLKSLQLIAFEYMVSTHEPPPPISKGGDSTPLEELEVPGISTVRELSPEVLAVRTIRCMARMLLEQSADPLRDIYSVTTVVETLEDALRDFEFGKAEVFKQLGYEQAVLLDHDPDMGSSEATELKGRIRAAAANYLANHVL